MIKVKNGKKSVSGLKLNLQKRLINLLLRYGIYLVFVLLCIGVSIATPVIDELIDEVKELRDGVEELTNDGITVMKDGIIEGIDDIKFGKVMEDKITKLAQNYTSFMDSDKNTNSSVQFIMQTEEIKTIEPIKTTIEEPAEEMRFFQRFLALFKR